MKLSRFKAWSWCGLLALALLLAACRQPTMLGVNAVGYNHRDVEIEYSVNGEAGGYIGPHRGGGKFSCCVRVPDPWQQGMTVTVRWEEGISDEQHERVVPVPQYDANKIGSLSVHFLRNGEIKAFVTMYTMQHPDYPLKGPEALLKPPPASTQTAH